VIKSWYTVAGLSRAINSKRLSWYLYMVVYKQLFHPVLFFRKKEGANP